MSRRAQRRTMLTGGGSGGAASDITFDDSGLIIVNGADVQEAIESLDAYLDGLEVGSPAPWWGTGVDGDVVISSNVTLTEDMYYDDLTIDNGFTLTTAGCRVVVNGTLTLNGTIRGGIITVGTAGQVAVTTGGGTAGNNGSAAGVNGGNGTTGTAFGGRGGSGGTGSAGTTTGGAGGTDGANTAARGGDKAMNNIMFASIAAFQPDLVPAGGTGGGSGGGGTAGTSGLGGGGGANIVVVAKTIAGAGSVLSAGRPGQAGQGANSGGGGGGGGGAIVVVTRSLTNPWTVDASGGLGGAGNGTGLAGVQGLTGGIYQYLGVV